MPSYLLATLMYLAPESISNLQAYQLPSSEQFIQLGFKENLLFLVFLSTFLMPASLIYYLYKVKIIPSLKMEELKSRRIPYFLTFLLYLFFGLFLKFRLPILNEIIVCIFSIAFCLFLVFVISLFWKISAHAIGISGLVGSFIGFYLKLGADRLFFPILISIILLGLIGTARLKLNAHTPLQILAGAALGFVVSQIAVYVFV